MIDIHTHLLPGVDDGSVSNEDSIALLREMALEGIDTVVLTPHYCPRRGYRLSAETLKSAYIKFCNAAAEEKIPVRLILGQEIYSSDYDNIVDKLDSGKLLTLGNSKYVLLEFSMTDKPDNLSETVYNLSLHGYIPIIAHLERYKWATTEIAGELKQEGCLIQLNASSFFDLKTAGFCKKLCKQGLADVIASDIHVGRKINMKKAKKIKGCAELFDSVTFD